MRKQLSLCRPLRFAFAAAESRMAKERAAETTGVIPRRIVGVELALSVRRGDDEVAIDTSAPIRSSRCAIWHLNMGYCISDTLFYDWRLAPSWRPQNGEPRLLAG